MSNDSKAPDSSVDSAQARPAAGKAVPAPSNLALDAIGYEAADPSLQSPFWTETEETGAPPGSLR